MTEKYGLTLNEITRISNEIKESLFNAMVGDKIITEDDADYLSQKYAVIAAEKGMLGRSFDSQREVVENEIMVYTFKTCNAELDDYEDDEAPTDEQLFN